MTKLRLIKGGNPDSLEKFPPRLLTKKDFFYDCKEGLLEDWKSHCKINHIIGGKHDTVIANKRRNARVRQRIRASRKRAN